MKADLIGDPTFRARLVAALRAAGELCLVVWWVQGAGRKDWYLAGNDQELEIVFAWIRPVGPSGYSDKIEVFATGEFPFRTREEGEWLRAKAVEVLGDAGEVVLACRSDGDPELHDVENTDHIGVIEDWFSEPHAGERLTGPHPFRNRGETTGVFVAWNPNEGGEIRPRVLGKRKGRRLSGEALSRRRAHAPRERRSHSRVHTDGDKLPATVLDFGVYAAKNAQRFSRIKEDPRLRLRGSIPLGDLTFLARSSRLGSAAQPRPVGI